MPKLQSLLIALFCPLALAACSAAARLVAALTVEPSLMTAAPAEQTLPAVTRSLPLISPPPVALSATSPPSRPHPGKPPRKRLSPPCSPLKDKLARRAGGDRFSAV